MKIAGSPFEINWTDRKAVIDYCRKLGSGNMVYKDPDKRNYNITHIDRDIPVSWIVYVA